MVLGSMNEIRSEEIVMVSNDEIAQPLFVQYTAFKADPSWRRLPYAAREDGRESFARVIEDSDLGIKTYPYSTVGMKTSCDLLLLRKGYSPISMPVSYTHLRAHE